MRRLAATWVLGLVAASPWWIAVQAAAASPTDPPVQPGVAVAGLLVLLGCAALAGWLARRDAEAHAGAGLWAGGGVGALAWLVGAVPALVVWTQLPVLRPLVAPEPNAVLATAIALAMARAASWLSASLMGMVIGGALVGWLVARRGELTLPAPGPEVTRLAWTELLACSLFVPAIFLSMPKLLESVGQAAATGQIVTPVPAFAQLVGLTAGPVLLAVAASAAVLVARVRVAWPPKAGAAVLALAGLGMFLPSLWIGGVRWEELGLLAVALAAGAAWGAAVTLRRLPEGPVWRDFAEQLPLALAGRGVSAVTVGLALALGAIARIGDLTAFGTGVPPTAEVVEAWHDLFWLWPGALILIRALELAIPMLILSVVVPRLRTPPAEPQSIGSR
jgi:hypothetical protein